MRKPLRLDPIGDLLLVTIIGFAAGWRLWGEGLVGSADAQLHLFRAFALDRALSNGLAFPRIVPDLLYGYGYPLFNYYPPGSSYVVVLLHRLGLGFIPALNTAYAISFVAAGIGMYALARRLLSLLAVDDSARSEARVRAGAVVAATAYALSPYMLIDVYTRGALAEAMAMALIPLLLLSVHNAVLETSRHALSSALLVAANVLLHSALAIFVIPIAGLYVLLVAFLARRDSKRGIVRLFLALLLGLGLSAFFWLPAWLERAYVNIENIETGFYDLRNNFLSWQSLLPAGMAYPPSFPLPIPPQLGLWQSTLALAGFIAGLAWVVRGPASARARHSVFLAVSLALAIGSLFLMTPASEPLWTHLPVLAGFSFPWRLLSLTAVALAILAGLSLHLLPFRTAQIGAALIIVVTGSLTLTQIRPDRIPLNEEDITLAGYWRFEFSTSMVGTTSANEYLPAVVKAGSYALPRVSDEAYGAKAVPSSEPPSVSLQEEGPQILRLAVASKSGTRLLAHAVYFKGWTATVDGVASEVRPEGDLGLVTVEVPPGDHEVELRYDHSDISRLGQLVSLATAFALGLLWLITTGSLRFVSTRFAPGRKFPRFVDACDRSDPYQRGSSALRALAPLGTVALLAVVLLWSPLQSRQPLISAARARSLSDQVALAGWRQPTVVDGALRLSLYWFAQTPPVRNEVEVITLRDPRGAEAGRWERLHADGYSPTLRWLQGEIVPDEATLPLPADISPGSYEVVVGLRSSNESQGLGHIELRNGSRQSSAAAAPAPQHSLRLGVGDGMRLLGYDISASAVQAGDTVSVTLYWRSEKVVDRDVTILLQLLDGKGDRKAGHDAKPRDADLPTLLWRPDEIIVDPHRLQLPPDLPPGRYDLFIGAYMRPEMARLAIADDSGKQMGDMARLASIDVGAK